MSEAVITLRRSLLRGGPRSTRVGALGTEDVGRWLYQNDQALLLWYNSKEGTLLLSDRYKSKPSQLPLKLDRKVDQKSGYTAQGNSGVPWQISSTDKGSFTLLLDVVPLWKKILDGALGRNLELYRHTPWCLYEEDGKDGLVLERADGLVRGRLVLQMQLPAVVLVPEMGCSSIRPEAVRSLREALERLDRLSSERCHAHKPTLAAVERLMLDKPGAGPAAVLGLERVLTDQQVELDGNEWSAWACCGVCPALVDAAARLGPSDADKLTRIASTLCHVLRNDSEGSHLANILGQNLQRSLLGLRTASMVILQLVEVLVKELQRSRVTKAVQVLADWLLPGLRYQYLQNGPRKIGLGMKASPLEPPKDTAHIVTYPLLGPDGDDMSEGIVTDLMSVYGTAATVDVDEDLQEAQNVQLLVLKCLLALSDAEAFRSAALRDPLPTNWVLEQLLQPSAVALQYYMTGLPRKPSRDEDWHIFNGIRQQRAEAVKVLVACAKARQPSMPPPDDICDATPRVRQDPVVERMGIELMNLVKQQDDRVQQGEQQDDQRQQQAMSSVAKDFALEACCDLLESFSEYLEGLESSVVVDLVFTCHTAAVGLIEVEDFLRKCGKMSEWPLAAFKLLGSLVKVYITLLKQAVTPGSMTYLLNHVTKTAGLLARSSAGGAVLGALLGESSSGSTAPVSPGVKGLTLTLPGSPGSRATAVGRLGAVGSPRRPASDQHSSVSGVVQPSGTGCLLQLAIAYVRGHCAQGGATLGDVASRAGITQHQMSRARRHIKLVKLKRPLSPLEGSWDVVKWNVARRCWLLLAVLLEACHKRPAACKEGAMDQGFATPEKVLVENLLWPPDASQQQPERPVVQQQLLMRPVDDMLLGWKKKTDVAVLRFEAAAFRAPGSMALKVPRLLEHLAPYHCREVQQLYREVARDLNPLDMELCKQHLRVLVVLTQRNDDPHRIRHAINRRRLLPTIIGILDARQRTAISPFEPVDTLRRHSSDLEDDPESPHSIWMGEEESPRNKGTCVPQLALQGIKQEDPLANLLSSSARSAASSAARRGQSTGGREGDAGVLSARSRQWAASCARDLEVADLTPKSDAGPGAHPTPQPTAPEDDPSHISIDPAAGRDAAAAVLRVYKFGIDVEADLDILNQAQEAGLTPQELRQLGVPEAFVEVAEHDAGSDSEGSEYYSESPPPSPPPAAAAAAELEQERAGTPPGQLAGGVPRLQMALVPSKGGTPSTTGRQGAADSRAAASRPVLSTLGPSRSGSGLGVQQQAPRMSPAELSALKAQLQEHRFGYDADADLEMWEAAQAAGLSTEDLNMSPRLRAVLMQRVDDSAGSFSARPDSYRRPDQLSPLPEMAAEGSCASSLCSASSGSPRSMAGSVDTAHAISTPIPALKLGSSSAGRASRAASMALRSSTPGGAGTPPIHRLSSMGSAAAAAATPSVLHFNPRARSLAGSAPGATSSTATSAFAAAAAADYDMPDSPDGSWRPASHRDEVPLADPALLSDPQLHELLVQLCLQLLVLPCGLLCPLVEPRSSQDMSLQQYILSMQQHLTLPGSDALLSSLHSSNTGTIQAAAAAEQLLRAGSLSLAEATTAAAGSAARAVLRVLKLCVPSLYMPPSQWGPTLASGAYGTIRTALRAGQQPEEVVVKIADVTSSSDNHTFLRVHTEITVLRHLDGMPGVIPLLDYGLVPGGQRSSGSGTSRSSDAWHLVFPRYSCSLKRWRQEQRHISLQNPQHVAGLLGVFSQVVEILAAVHEARVVHFDIKCDNVLISKGCEGQPAAGRSKAHHTRSLSYGGTALVERELAAATAAAGGAGPSGTTTSSSSSSSVEQLQRACEQLGVEPLDEVVLADFGDALWFPADKAQTMRHRGTELFSSPEMLMLGTHRPESSTFDRRRGAGAGAPHDVWSLGCALYELLTGQVLFEKQGVARVLAALHNTDLRQPMLDGEEEQLLVQRELVELLNWILRRDARWRPGVGEISTRLQRLVTLFSTRKQ